MLEIKAESSPKIVKKGDVFNISVTVNNNTNILVKLSSINIELPHAFLRIKRIPSSEIPNRREMFRRWWWDKLPPTMVADKLPLEISQEIQPHSRYEKSFEIKAGWSGSPFRPRPDTFKIPVTVSYNDSTGKTDTEITSLELSLFPSFGTMLLGTLAGSLLGTFVRNSEEIPKLRFDTIALPAQIMSVFVIPLIFGLIAGRILTRKKDVQPFLTIEDFWGGIVIGFIVGYSGSQFLEQLPQINFNSTSPGQ
jgi:hypothetical protein